MTVALPVIRFPELITERKSAPERIRFTLASTEGWLGRKLYATLATTRCQDGTAGTSLHA
jgi:hypothetical protein